MFITPCVSCDTYNMAGVRCHMSPLTPKPKELGSCKLEKRFTSSKLSPVICHVSCVMCQVSPVTCHVSHVTCNITHFVFFLSFLQSGEAIRWRVCYQRGTPCLVCIYLNIIQILCSWRCSLNTVITE